MKGCFASAERYRAAIVLASDVPRNFLLGKTAIIKEIRGVRPNGWVVVGGVERWRAQIDLL